MRKRKLRRTIDKITKELLALPREELIAELDKQKDTEIYKLLEDARIAVDIALEEFIVLNKNIRNGTHKPVSNVNIITAKEEE